MKFIVSKRISSRAKSRLVDNEIVILRGRGNKNTHQHNENSVLLKTKDDRWFGWMELGKDVELSPATKEK